MFDGFYDKIKENSNNSNLVTIDLNTPEFSMTVLRDKLDSVDELDEKELFTIMKNNYKMVLRDIFVNKKPDYLVLVTNTKFLSVLIQVMNSIEPSMEDRIYCNKIAYDYFMTTKSDLIENTDNEYIKQLMLTLSKTVNRDKIPSLLGYGIPEDIATKLALSRYSSNKEEIAIKRLNFVIISSPISIMTEQRIVWIYEVLFNRITTLFEYVMFDVCDRLELNKEQDEIYSTITLAILDILNDQPMENILYVLKNYVNDYNLSYIPTGCRCSLRSLSADYSRINYAVAQLDMVQIFVP